MRKYLSFYVVLGLVVVFGLGLIARGMNDSVTVQGDQINNYYGVSGEAGNQMGITTKSDFQAVDITATSDLSVGDDLTVTDEISYGGVSGDWITGTFADATTTPVAVVNPFSANVIVDAFEAYIQNGTSTIEMTCGTSSSPYLAADPTDLLIDDLSMASSTVGTATTTAYVKNGDDYAGTSLKNAGTNSEDAILWKSGEYISCYVSTLYSGALTETTNIFSGYYRIHAKYDDNF